MTYVKRFKTMYMHTFEDKPASFDGKDYIYFASARSPAMLVASLRQIRREQQKAIRRSRLARAMGDTDYGYIRVEVPL